ncbi:MAG: tyrosine-type recombinase/integrase [Acidobacteria bacterium]|nr:tyrosine-type recombinase/integrase [Acidobacteriota bacterium]
MNGTVYKRENGAWAYSIYAGRNEQGKQKRIFKSGFKTKRAADDAKNEKLREMKAPATPAPSPRTFDDFMSEWFEQHATRNCAPKTLERYRQLWEYVKPTVKAMRLSDLTALHLEREYNRLKDSGGRHRTTKASRPLSVRTVRHIAGLVKTALNTAVRWNLVQGNPATACVLPKGERKEAPAHDAGQVETLLSFAKDHWAYEILEFANGTGCRRGEILALTWSDVDLENSIAWINKSLEQTKAGLRLKSTKNRKARQVHLPKSTVKQLRDHRESQANARNLMGADYRTDLDLVFAGPDGEYWKPDTVSAAASAIARRAGLPGATHIFRHSHGSQMLAAGVPLPTVSKRLGHSSTYVTASIYAHSFQREDEEAAQKWDAARKEAVERLSVKH